LHRQWFGIPHGKAGQALTMTPRNDKKQFVNTPPKGLMTNKEIQEFPVTARRRALKQSIFTPYMVLK